VSFGEGTPGIIGILDQSSEIVAELSWRRLLLDRVSVDCRYFVELSTLCVHFSTSVYSAVSKTAPEIDIGSLQRVQK